MNDRERGGPKFLEAPQWCLKDLYSFLRPQIRWKDQKEFQGREELNATARHTSTRYLNRGTKGQKAKSWAYDVEIYLLILGGFGEFSDVHWLAP